MTHGDVSIMQLNPAPVSELEATRRLETTDFDGEYHDTGVPATLPPHSGLVFRMIDTTLPLSVLGPVEGIHQDATVAAVHGSDSTSAEMLRLLTEENKALRESIAGLNKRVDAIMARIAKYNLGASHKL